MKLFNCLVPKMRFQLLLIPLFILFLAACGGSGGSGGGTNNNGPWLGNWIQVNFLATDGNGIWDQDNLSVIGFTRRSQRASGSRQTILGMAAQ